MRISPYNNFKKQYYYIKIASALIAYKNKQYNLLMIAYSKNDASLTYLDSLNYDTATIYDKETQTKGKVFMISGCTDKQISADAFINNKYNGALTWSYLEALKNNSTTLTWRKLVQTMRENLKINHFSQFHK